MYLNEYMYYDSEDEDDDYCDETIMYEEIETLCECFYPASYGYFAMELGAKHYPEISEGWNRLFLRNRMNEYKTPWRTI